MFVVFSITLFLLCFVFSSVNLQCCSQDEEGCCPCFPSRLVQKSFDNLAFQYPPAPIREYCRIAKKDLKIFTNYTNSCNHREVKKLITYLTDGYTQFLKKRCSPNAPAELTCERQLDAYDGIQLCIDKFVNAAYYILKNIPAKDQMGVKCCLRQKRRDCMFQAVNKVCGRNYAVFLLTKITEPAGFYSDMICANTNICEEYAEQMNEMNVIFDRSRSSGRTFSYVFFRAHINTVLSECYTYD